MPVSRSETLHATCVAIAGRAILIEGASGSGKSDLALRLIDRGALLVSDDYTEVRRTDGFVSATAPPTIAGKIEVHGLGIVAMPHLQTAPVALVVRLTSDVARMPESGRRRIAGLDIARLDLLPHEASAPLKVELALAGRVIE